MKTVSDVPVVSMVVCVGIKNIDFRIPRAEPESFYQLPVIHA